MRNETHQGTANRQYLIVMDDGELYSASDIGAEEKKAANERFIDLLDITDPSQPVAFIENEWHPINAWADLYKGENQASV